jgi:hypothetical protein
LFGAVCITVSLNAEPAGTVRATPFGITNVTSVGWPEPGSPVSVCVELPIAPKLVFESVTCTVRVLGPAPELRRSQSGTATLPAGSVSGDASAGVNVHATGLPNATVTAPSPLGGLRDNATPGALRK